MTLQELAPGRWKVAGDVADDDAARLVEACRTLAFSALSEVDLELGELELESGVACGRVVDAIRCLLGRGARLTLFEPPQALAHVLYRTGDLPRLRLVNPRFDEATSS